MSALPNVVRCRHPGQRRRVINEVRQTATLLTAATNLSVTS